MCRVAAAIKIELDKQTDTAYLLLLMLMIYLATNCFRTQKLEQHKTSRVSGVVGTRRPGYCSSCVHNELYKPFIYWLTVHLMH